ncbi:hypothetical protein [Cupriavidus nantongensis]|uniref:Uncharacterized protein n=1 Tax=Cupriavidus nantongensis TaxID=1796606 RepID=A0A142JIU6_9BURK|nr:hypothetical protein [Cupriavidus nantongensis]AMR78008.1 hypothetical protein A2G96_09785 [Cupriavidus nantongensis]
MQANQSITLSQVRDALHSANVFSGNEDWEIRMRSVLAVPVIDGVRVVGCPLTDGSAVYDWSQSASELRDGDVFIFADGKCTGVMVEAWPVLVAGEADALHTLAADKSWDTLDAGKYAAAARVAAKLAPQEPEPTPAAIKPATLAGAFARTIREYLTREELSEVIERNRAEADEGICHSHDFCDANEAMVEAFELCGVPMDFESQTNLNLWGNAWNTAAHADFDPAKIAG